MPTPPTAADLDRFDVSPDHGFLPGESPLRSFGDVAGPFLRRLDELAEALPALLDANELRPAVETLDPPAPGWLDGLSPRARRRAYTVCGFLANGYVHQLDAPRVEAVPEGLAVPLYQVANDLGRTPVLSYDAYALYNWRRLDPEAELRPHQLGANLTFSGLPDERWFVVIHVAIEAAAGPAIAAIGRAQRAMLDDDEAHLLRAIRLIEESLHEVIGLLDRMDEHNAPGQYGHGFRPYLDALTGVEFEGVAALEGPQSYRGASGAQSTIFPALDAAIGVDHGDNPLVEHLETLRADMPPAHRAFVRAVEAGPDLRAYARDADREIRDAFNECIDRMVRFRELHREVVATYLADELGETEGTGGTPYGRFLSMFVDDTRECKLSA